MSNKNTTISGIITIILTILPFVLKLINGEPLDANDYAMASAGSATGYGLWSARDAQTPETVVEKTTTEEITAR